MVPTMPISTSEQRAEAGNGSESRCQCVLPADCPCPHTGVVFAERAAGEIRQRHGLSSLHLFVDDGSPAWRVFGARRDPKGVQASVEEGRGVAIADALRSLDERLSAGVFNRVAWE